jgi:hypothetical protein
MLAIEARVENKKTVWYCGMRGGIPLSAGGFQSTSQQQRNSMTSNARRVADRNTARSRRALEEASEVTQEAAGRAEDVVKQAGQGLLAYNRKLLEITQENLNASFDCAQEIIGAQSVTKFAEIAMRYTQTQAAAFVEQAKDLGDSFRQLAGDAAQPANVSPLFRQAR